MINIVRRRERKDFVMKVVMWDVDSVLIDDYLRMFDNLEMIRV